MAGDVTARYEAACVSIINLLFETQAARETANAKTTRNRTSQ